MTSALLDICRARQGTIALVGAGGKKTTLYRLAQSCPGRVGITTTVHLPPFPNTLAGAIIIAPSEQLLAQVVQAAYQRLIAFAHPAVNDSRVAGVTLAMLAEIQARVEFNVLLIKADGARQRLIKAPAEYEPVIPANTQTVLGLVSARAMGRKLDERIAHRVELIEACTGAQRGQVLQPIHIARLIASEQGLQRGISNADFVPIINQVDNQSYYQVAATAAKLALKLSDRFDYVVLAAMRRAQPIVEVVQR